jgi:hypothetical protein
LCQSGTGEKRKSKGIKREEVRKTNGKYKAKNKNQAGEKTTARKKAYMKNRTHFIMMW